MITIASTVYEVQEVELQDGKTVTLKPANIKTLRIFMKKIDELAKLTNDETAEDDYFEIIIDAAIICLKKQRPEFVDREVAEEALDLDTIYRVLKVCGGVDLQDPKLIAAAQKAILDSPGKT